MPSGFPPPGPWTGASPWPKTPGSRRRSNPSRPRSGASLKRATNGPGSIRPSPRQIRRVRPDARLRYGDHRTAGQAGDPVGQLPQGLSRGDFVKGGISLGVDPFFYFEMLHALPGMPPLIYSWRINSIRIQTAPFIKKGNIFSRDEDKLGYKAIERTNAWKDDNGSGEYLLTCARLDIPPKFRSATAT